MESLSVQDDPIRVGCSEHNKATQFRAALLCRFHLKQTIVNKIAIVILGIIDHRSIIILKENTVVIIILITGQRRLIVNHALLRKHIADRIIGIVIVAS